MCRLRGLSLVLFVFLATAGAQTRLTIEQCKADLELWGKEPSAVRALTVESLEGRQKELLFCQMDYPNAPEQLQWFKLDQQMNVEMGLRYLHFLTRHNLTNQFFEEDEQGKR